MRAAGPFTRFRSNATGAGNVDSSIVLIGMMGAGKSAVGAELARRLGVSVRDTDAEIARAAAMTIPEIFARDGETFFRARESEVLARVLREAPGIVSTGGGAWLRAENRALIGAAGVSVWLNPSLATLWQRVKQKPSRPLLQTEDPRGTLDRLLAERAPAYALADITVNVHGADSVETTATRVLDALRDWRANRTPDPDLPRPT